MGQSGQRSGALENLEPLVEQFHRDGYLVIPDALEAEQAERLRAGVERAFAGPDAEADFYGPGLAKIWR